MMGAIASKRVAHANYSQQQLCQLGVVSNGLLAPQCCHRRSLSHLHHPLQLARLARIQPPHHRRQHRTRQVIPRPRHAPHLPSQLQPLTMTHHHRLLLAHLAPAHHAPLLARARQPGPRLDPLAPPHALDDDDAARARLDEQALEHGQERDRALDDAFLEDPAREAGREAGGRDGDRVEPGAGGEGGVVGGREVVVEGGEFVDVGGGVGDEGLGGWQVGPGGVELEGAESRE